MAESYGEAISDISAIKDAASGAFDPGGSSPETAFNSLADALWNVLAGTQDNLNDTSTALILWLNAVVASDSGHAQTVQDKIEDWKSEVGDASDYYDIEDEDVDVPLEDIDFDSDTPFEVPDHDPAERPESDLWETPTDPN